MLRFAVLVRIVVVFALAALGLLSSPSKGVASPYAVGISISCSIADVDTSKTLDSAHVLSTSDSLFAAEPPPRIGRDRRYMPGLFDPILNLPRDWRDWAVKDVTLEHWPMITLVAVSTTAMIIYDNELWQPFRKIYEKDKTIHDLSDAFVFMGDGKFQFGVAGAFTAYGALFGDKRALRTASQTVEVILATGGVVQLLKHLTGRESPIVTTTPTGVWKFFPNQIEYAKHVPHYDAFPSGHLATATATLTVILNNYPEAKWLRPLGYTALAGIATGLVATSIHWWSDFPLSLALGYGFGTLLSPNPDQDVSVRSQPEEKKDLGEAHGATRSRLSLATFYPVIPNGGGTGIGMMIRF